MTTGCGHASETERAAVRSLEERLRSGVDVDALLDLAQLYLEPVHRELHADAIFRTVRALWPESARARIGIAYTSIHVLMDEPAASEAVRVLHDILELPDWAGVAYMLLARARGELGQITDVERIHLLERSVQAEPDWVENRCQLADAYLMTGRQRDAVEQIDRAIANLLQPRPEGSIVDESFHDCYTGLNQSMGNLRDDRKRIVSTHPGNPPMIRPLTHRR